MKVKSKKKFFIIIGGGIFLVSTLAVLFLWWRSQGSRAEGKTIYLEISNREETVVNLRRGLKNHAKQITVNFTTKGDAMGQIAPLADELVEEALAETEDPAEGDYIRFQYGGYEVRYHHERERDGYHYTVRIIPQYYTYLVQEEQVNEWIGEIIENFHFTESTSDYEKIRTIYKYVYKNVSYDRVHKEKKQQHLKTTVYAALKYRAAVCQGYAVLMYRLLREAGINARVIEGEAVTDSGALEHHAWNIVALDGRYYNLDVTLDKVSQTEKFFLKSEKDFSGHTRNERYLTSDFERTYPMAKNSYHIKKG